MSATGGAAAATAEPVSEAEKLEPVNGPVRFTFNLYRHFLICPQCGGENLHHGAVTVFDRNEDEPRVAKIEVRDCSALVTRVESKTSGNPSDRRDGIAIEFWCEECEGTSEFLIAQHKGTSFVG